MKYQLLYFTVSLVSITSPDYLLTDVFVVVFLRGSIALFVWCVQFNGKLVLIRCCNFSLESSCEKIVQGKHISRMCWWYLWLGTAAISAASSFGSRQRIPCHLMVP